MARIRPKKKKKNTYYYLVENRRSGSNCFLQNHFGGNCKTFLEVVAKRT